MRPALVPLGSLLSGFTRPPSHVPVTNVDDATWREVVGPGVVQRAMPQKLRDGVLTVRVASSAWAQQLSMLRDELLERLRQRGYKVSDLRFKVGPVMPPRRLLGASVFVPYQTPVPLPPPLEHALFQVPDVPLRMTLARAAAANLAWQRSTVVPPPISSPLPGLLPQGFRPPFPQGAPAATLGRHDDPPGKDALHHRR